jgi:hypothetical protein
VYMAMERTLIALVFVVCYVSYMRAMVTNMHHNLIVVPCSIFGSAWRENNIDVSRSSCCPRCALL